MVCRPSRPINLGILYLLVILAFRKNRYREPLHTLRRLDLIAITPVTARILHVVIQDEFIHRGDHVEIALPRDVVGLNNGNLLHFFKALVASHASFATLKARTGFRICCCCVSVKPPTMGAVSNVPTTS